MKLKVIIPTLVLFAGLVALVPRTAKWGYEYHRGSQWKYETLTAQFDFPLMKTQDQIELERSEASVSVTPYYRFSSEVASASLRKIDAVDFSLWPGLKSEILSEVSSVYENGIIPSHESAAMVYVQKSKKTEKRPSSEFYLLAEARDHIASELSRTFPDVKVDSILRAEGVYEMVMPNVIYDAAMTSLIHGQVDGSISTTDGYVTAGTVLVSNEAIVTDEIAQVLDSYKAEYERVVGETTDLLSFAGNVLLVLLVLVCLYFAIYFSNPMILEDPNRFIFLLTVFGLMAASELLLVRFASSWIFLFPFTVGAIFLQAFFRTRLIYPVYIVSLFPLLLFAEGGAPMFVMFIVSATVTLNFFRYFSKGVKQFVAAMINFAVLAVSVVALKLSGLLNCNLPTTLMMLFGASILQVLCFPLVYLMERVFNLVSTSRLIELEDMSNSLLRDLEQKAPGTFQHSLQVMNLASAAARAIGADEALVKAGALYHDIGKTLNPLCYVENESLSSGDVKYHTGLTPLQSAQDIIRHVTDGLELAREHKLPAPVSDFILTHHGTNCVSFFYDKYLVEGGDPSMQPEFCYPGRKPQTKEQALLMLCDSLEAASRSLKDHSSEAVSKLVEKIVQYKLDDDQLVEADLTLKELATIKTVMKSYLGQIHHARIKYPERKNNK